MEKQKAIELAYGEYWEKVKDKINEDGWVYEYNISVPIKRRLDSFCEFKLLRYAEIGHTPMFYYRPKSLQGIENNNGWISVNDKMPTEIGMYFIVNNEGEVTIELAIKRTEHYNHKVFYHIEFMSNDIITHWQPIIKPKPPIY